MSVPVAPGGLPLLGHAWELLRRPLDLMTTMRDVGPVVRFRLGPRDAYMVTTPDLVREVLLTKVASFSKGGPLMETTREVVGNGLATSDGDFHKRQRRLVQPAFHRQRIAGYTTAMVEVTKDRVDAWSDGRRLDLMHEMHTISSAVVARSLFTTPDHDAPGVLRDALPEIMSGIGRRAYLPLGWVHELPLPVNRRYDKARAKVFGLINDIIAEYRAKPGDRGDLLSMMMAAQDEGGGAMTDEQLFDECVTMMVAGTETASSVLAWAFHVMALYPEVEKRVHAEVDEVLGGRAATFDDVPALDYTRRMFQELMRLYPIIWMLTRHTETDVELGGHLIPAGSDVFFSAYILHMDPSWWPSPEEFDPDRWLPERAGESPRHAYVPFSSGTRKCIGDQFAQVEMIVTMATIASGWRLRPVGEPRVVANSTYRLEKPVMRVEAR